MKRKYSAHSCQKINAGHRADSLDQAGCLQRGQAGSFSPHCCIEDQWGNGLVHQTRASAAS